ncbi:MAG: TetR/AcrR family transcriptional regulator [Deltaproteobacteria bacterium]|nr:TetR/AcrR family transcriptional regulator [Deltaproteobacteria bacterium]MBW2396082.1 TetR/AcrR family transcriptional regulator [Deltaproteobacteria bacterium]
MPREVNQRAVEDVPLRRGGPARREAILNAALRLFRQRGFHGTSINEIGNAAGVTGPALYRHFSGKGEILAEAIRAGSRRIAAATREALTSEDLAPEDALEALVRSYVGVALDNADIYAAYMLEARHLSDEFRRPLRRSELRHRDEWKRLVLELHPDMTDDEAKTLVRMAIFAVTSFCMEPSRLDRKALIDLACERLNALLDVHPNASR